MASHSPDNVAALAARVRQLEARVASLEAEREQPSRASLTGPKSTKAALPRSARVIAPALSDPRRSDFETMLGLTWFNRVGAALLVVGLILTALWANDRGYLSPLFRNALGGSVALAIFVLGLRQSLSNANGRRRFGIGVMLIGVCGLYAVPVSASRIDTVLPVALAAVLLVATTLALAALALRYRSAALTLFGLLGGLALPLLSPWVGGGVALAALHLVPTIVGFVWIQHAIGARRIDLAASAGLIAYFLAWTTSSPSWTALAVGLGIWLAHMCYSAFLTRRRQLYRGFDIAMLVAAAAAALAATALAPAPYARCGLLLTLFAGHVWLWRARPQALLALFVLSGAALLWLLAMDFYRPDAVLEPWALALLASGVALSFMAAYLARALPGRPGQDYDVVATCATALFAFSWLQLGSQAISSITASCVIAMASGLWLGVDTAVRRGDPRGRGHGWAQVMTVSLLTVAAIAALWSTPLPDQTLSLWSSLVFIASGLALLAVGVRASYSPARILGLTALAASLVKVVATDVWSLGQGYRIATLIAIGLGLLCASFFYSRHLDSPSQRREADEAGAGGNSNATASAS